MELLTHFPLSPRTHLLFYSIVILTGSSEEGPPPTKDERRPAFTAFAPWLFILFKIYVPN